MDGYPRTLAQAASFDQVLRQQFLDLTAVVLLQVSDEEIVQRLSGRWSCPKPGCKATYHTVSNPPQRPGICDRLRHAAWCSARTTSEETVRSRLMVYHKNTEELIPHYRDQGLLREVAGRGRDRAGLPEHHEGA